MAPFGKDTDPPPRRRASAATARRTVLWSLGWFALLQVGLGVAMQTCVPHWLDPEYGAKAARLRRRLGAAGDRPVLIAALGSSLTDYGLRGSTVERALERALGRTVLVANFGIPGAGPFSELLYLRRILTDAGRPDLVLVEVLPALLVERAWPSEVAENRLPAAALRHNELSLVGGYGGDVRRRLHGAWWSARAVPWWSCRINILAALVPRLLPLELQQCSNRQMDETGWTPSPIPDEPEVRRRVSRAVLRKSSAQLDDFHLDARPMAALGQVLEVCRREGLATALLLMPEAPSYRRLYPAGAWDEVEGLVRTLGRRYGAPVINAREWMAEEDFLDTLHLVPSSATTFSERFAREALVPLLSGGACVSSRTRLSQEHTRTGD